MGSEFLGLRLNYKKHEDIINWLSKFEDKSNEARRLLLLGIRVSEGETQVTTKKRAPLTWDFPKGPTVKEEKKVDKNNTVMNILGSFGE